MNIQLRNLGAVLILAVLTASGCGGSSGGGDTSPPPTDPPPTDPPPTDPPPSGGIVRSGVAVSVGPISGFGSVIVNGVRYETNNETSFIRDDNPSSEDQFKVGETVIVKGSIDDDNTNAVAESVELDEIVKGPATQASGTTATVLGQSVTSDAGTLIDDDCLGVSFDDLSGLTGFFAVEVYGNVQPDGTISATFIECKTAADFVDDEFEVNGIVAGVTATTFMINGLQVDYSETPLIQNFPTGQPENGNPVEVKGAPDDFNAALNVLAASKVEYKGNRLDFGEGDHYEIEGFISDFRAIDDFDVRVGLDTLTVITDPDTTTFEGDETLLGDNVKVEVEGEIDSENNLFATKVEIKTSTNIRVTGVVDPIENGVIRILNIPINTTDATRFDDKRDDDPSFGAGSIMADDYIEARGQEAPPGQITAFEVRRDDLDTDPDNTELRGFTEPDSVVTETGAPGYRESFQVLGVTIDMTGAGITYRDPNELPITAEQFWSVIEIEAAGGNAYLVDIKGAEQADGTTLKATEVELEME